MAKRSARWAAGSPSIRMSEAFHLASQASRCCAAMHRSMSSIARSHVCAPSRAARWYLLMCKGDDAVKPVCFSLSAIQASSGQQDVRSNQRSCPAAMEWYATGHRHGDRRAAARHLNSGAAQRAHRWTPLPL